MYQKLLQFKFNKEMQVENVPEGSLVLTPHCLCLNTIIIKNSFEFYCLVRQTKGIYY